MKMAKKGRMANAVADKLPINVIRFNLCEYNQMQKIYTEKNTTALKET